MSRRRTAGAIEAASWITIGELVRLTGTRYSTLKFYTEQGMLDFEQAGENLTRRYRRVETAARLDLITQLKAQGHTIPQIKQALRSMPGATESPPPGQT